MTKSDHNRFMQMAIDLSEQAVDTNKGGPFGAVIVKNNKIIGSAYNQVVANIDPSAHGEIMAIRDACKNIGTRDLTDCEIYTSAEPCPMCMSAIYWANIKTVYYANSQEDSRKFGFDDKLILEELKKPKNERTIKSIKIENPAALKVFEKAKK